jgi:hypothetical protein
MALMCTNIRAMWQEALEVAFTSFVKPVESIGGELMKIIKPPRELDRSFHPIRRLLSTLKKKS